MRGAWVALALICAFVAHPASAVPSQQPKQLVPPVTRQAETGNEVQGSAESQKTEATKSPVTANASKASDHQTSGDNSKGGSNPEASKWADPITWFTLALVLVGAAQVFIYWKQKRIMERALAATDRSIALARDEFLATHRPRLILREAYTAPDSGHPITVTYMLSNIGGSPAEIVVSKFAIFRSVAGGTKRQVVFEGELMAGEISNPIPPGTVIDAGSSYQAPCAALYTGWGGITWHPILDARARKTNLTGNPGSNPFDHVYFYGRIAYRDLRGGIRHTAFYRILEGDSYRFVPLGDDQLEYSDEG